MNKPDFWVNNRRQYIIYNINKNKLLQIPDLNLFPTNLHPMILPFHHLIKYQPLNGRMTLMEKELFRWTVYQTYHKLNSLVLTIN